MTLPIPALRPDIAITTAASRPQTDRLKQTATEFEAAILTELLQAAGAGQTASDFGGGAGEEQFASFLLRAQVERIAERGGIGLAELALRAMMGRSATDGPA
jgi:flagellar protein FlgJ